MNPLHSLWNSCAALWLLTLRLLVDARAVVDNPSTNRVSVASVSVAGATPGNTRPPAVPARDAVNAQLHPAQRFFVEILSDESGLTVYRLQIAIWTLALGIVFCVRVYKSLTMPELPDTLLGLMGLSSATFLGFKTNERPAPPNRP